jgi:hypothetical protein
VPRAIALDLTRLSRGRHEVTLVVTAPDGTTLTVQRDIEIVEK